MQTDIICYGADLPRYLMNELADHEQLRHAHKETARRIDVWSDLSAD